MVKRRHQHALLALDPFADLVQQIVHLGPRRAHDDRRVHQSGRANHLLDHRAVAFAQLEVRRRRRNVDRLIDHRRELVEVERPVVERRRQAKAVLDQGFFARAVAAVHAADLRHGDVALVDHQEKIVGKVTQQRRRRLARLAPGQMPRVVFDAGAEAHLFEQFEVVERALLQALRFEQFALILQLLQALFQLQANASTACLRRS